MLLACGSNQAGQLGIEGDDQNELTKVHEMKGKKVNQISAGSNHSLVLTECGLYGAGDNSKGQLGMSGEAFNKFEKIELNNVEYIACGWNCSFAIVGGRIYVTGDESFGVLGIEHSHRKWTMLETLENICEISCGLRHTIFLDKSGSIWGCGSGKQGVFGTLNDKLLKPTKLPFENVVSIACGQFHTVILTNSKEIFVFGRNKFGQLGQYPSEIKYSVSPVLIPNILNPIKVYSGWSTCGVWTEEGKLFVWGRGDHGQLGYTVESFNIIPTLLSSYQFKSVAFGSEHVLGIDSNRNLIVWGWNEHGNLGIGTHTTRFTPIAVPGLANVELVSAGGGHTLIYTN
jgi:secretion-regulating guanine nucleotide exchange factor